MVNNPWLDFVQNWQKAMGAGASPGQGIGMGPGMGGADFWSQAAPMFAFGQMLNTLQQQNASLTDRDSWLRGWNDMLDAMRVGDPRPSDPISQMFQGLMPGMGSPAAGMFSSPLFAGMMPSRPAPLANWPSWLDLLNPMGANRETHLGPAREWQDKLSEVSQAASAWVESQQQLQRSHMDVMLEAWKQLGTDAFEQSQDGKASVRDMFDKWMETAESLYQDQVTTEDYSSLFGDYVNRMSEMKLAVQKVLDDVLAMLDLPTRRELNAMQEQQTSSEELRPDVAALQEEVAALRAHVDALTDQLNLAEPASPEPDEAAVPPGAGQRASSGAASGRKSTAASSSGSKAGSKSRSKATSKARSKAKRKTGKSTGAGNDAKEWDIDRLS